MTPPRKKTPSRRSSRTEAPAAADAGAGPRSGDAQPAGSAARGGAPGVLLFAAFALGLVLSGVHVDPRLWGVHQYAFLSRTAWLLAAGMLAALLIPAVARALGRGTQGIGLLVQRFWFVPLLAGAVLLGAASHWRLGYPFQGDGMVWVAALKEGKLFHHFEPLAASWVRAVAMAWSPQSPETAAGVLSILLGPVYVVATALLCRVLFAEALSLGVAWLLLLLHPMLLLFFGYVESYPLVIVFQVFFALTLVACARGRLHWIVPSLTLGLAVSAHLTALAWSPALVVLAWGRGSRSPQRVFLQASFFILLALVVAITTSGAVGSSPWNLVASLIGEPGLGGQSWTWMFSWRHGLDLLNELTLLLAPALVLLAGSVPALRLSPQLEGSGSVESVAARSGWLASPEWRAILALLPGPLAVALFVEPRIGGGRDWDLYLPLVLPVVLWSVRAWSSEWARRSVAGGKVPGRKVGPHPAPRRGAWPQVGRAVGLAAVSWFGWMACGVDEGISALRLQVLQEPGGTFSNFARGYANETLGIYYRGKNSDAARAAWLRATQANPANPRYFNNLGIEELRRDEVDAACVAFRRTLALGMEEYFVIFNVANCERRAGEYEIAEGYYDRLIVGWPGRWEAFNARGVVRVHLGRPAEALEDLQTAVRLAPKVAETHANRGLALQALGRPEEAREAWEQALALDPSNRVAQQQLELQRQMQ